MRRRQRYDVRLTYNTHADTPEEALALALSAIDTRSSAYVEVFDGEVYDLKFPITLLEGELTAKGVR